MQWRCICKAEKWEPVNACSPLPLMGSLLLASWVLILLLMILLIRRLVRRRMMLTEDIGRVRLATRTELDYYR